MTTTNPAAPAAPGPGALDTLIKLLTIVKLLAQIAFYGILIYGVIWFIRENPLPELMQGFQEDALRAFMEQAGR